MSEGDNEQPSGDQRRSDTLRYAGAAISAALAAMLFYGIHRTHAAVTADYVDPRTVVESTRIEYFWRLQVGAFIASVVGMGYLMVAKGREHVLFRIVAKAALPATVFCTALSSIWP